MAQFLRTATPMGDWRSFKITVPSGGMEIGKIYKVQDTYGVFFSQDGTDGDTIAEGESGYLIYEAEKIMVAKDTNAINAGDIVYYNASAGTVSATNGGSDIAIGICVESASASDTQVMIDLDGRAMINIS